MNFIPEEKNNSFTCPNCEINRGDNKHQAVKQPDNTFKCLGCDFSYPTRKVAMKKRIEWLAQK